MKSGKVGLAMIGCGQIAHAHLRGIEETPGAELVAAMDTVEEKARAVAEKHDAKLYTSVDAVLADERVDAVILPLPHHLHLPITVQAAEAGKHILVEKPMALNLPEARQMVEAAEKANVHFMVGQSTRFRPEVWAANEVVRSGKLGKIRQCIYYRAFFTEKLSTEWRYSSAECGGLYLPLFASHDADMIFWLMDDSPAKVHSVLRSHTALVDAESDGSINIEMAGGGIVSLAFSMTCHIYRHNCLFIGTDATLMIDNGKVHVNKEEITVDKSTDTFVRQMREFVGAILSDREPMPSGRDVLPTMALLDAAKESYKKGRVVEIPDL